MDERLRFDARMIMLSDPQVAPDRGHLRQGSHGAQVISASCPARNRRPVGVGRRPGVDDHESSLGVVQVEALSGQWLVTMQHGRQARRSFHPLVAVLRSVEAELGPDAEAHARRWVTLSHDPSLHQLGVVTARHTPGDGRGKLRIAAVRPDVENPSPEEALAAWVGDYLRARDDLVLAADGSRPVDDEIFVWVTFGGAPWLVESFLADLVPDLGVLPAVPAPDLPGPLRRVWVAAEHSDTGCRWDGHSWQTFSIGA